MDIPLGVVGYTLEGTTALTGMYALFLFICLIVVLPAALFRRWYFYRFRLKHNLITAEYEPPLGLTPAEVGYLFDGKLRDREIAGSVIYLVQRGYLKIKRVNGQKRLFLGDKKPEKITAFEHEIIGVVDSFSADGLVPSELWSPVALQSDFAVNRSHHFTQLVHNELKTKGYVKGDYRYYFFKSTLGLYALVCLIGIYLPLFLFWVTIVWQTGEVNFIELLIFMGFGWAIHLFGTIPLFSMAVILNYIRGRIIGREWIITPKLKRMWPQIIGYRQYVKLVENERLEFQSQNLAEMSRNETLAFAVALGFVRNWRNLL